MELRKDNLIVLKLCRFCLSQDETLTTLYDRNRTPKNSVPLALKILSCVSIEVFPSDKMLSYICNRCKFFMDICYDFKQMCRQADENVIQYIQTGNDLNSVTWPSNLQKIFRAATIATPALTVMKTVVEGGATVQVTAHGSESEEDDDENVYNVKIGDGSEGSKSARVKVISDNKQIKAKSKEGKDSDDESDQEPQSSPEGHAHSSKDTWAMVKEDSNTKGEVKELQDGRWACDECDCTYPLQQLLNLHKAHKHRERSVQCDQCDAKFFSKYDLETHQLRHTSDEMLFKCAACGKQFKRHILLKRHEKLVHADLAQLACPSCPATFLSQQELQQHNEKHILTKERRFGCDLCDKRFLEKSTLQRHKANVHDKEAAFACVYCPERFSSAQKLTKHVRAHAGERAYPCKYCDKSFVKSHHYTRHLRVKHREAIRTARGPFGESTDHFRCEQCEDTFATQDELIYHSAIHATQNLVCPLCQEKFEDVDAVTSHIKSHVNGTEFMCDLCELVFTTKEKLDNHINNAHEDELRGEEGQDESSLDMEAEEDEDCTAMNIKEEDGDMVVEINKADEFMLPNSLRNAPKSELANLEESDSEMIFTELATVDPLAMKSASQKPIAATPGGAILTKTTLIPAKNVEKSNISHTAPILRKAEEVKRKVQSTTEPVPEKKTVKVESNNTGASDKSLRLLEKELQELKRTNTRSEAVKTPAKPVEMLRNKRPQIHTSTPKLRTSAVEEKKSQVPTKSPAVEKKQSDRRIVTKENKEPKDTKEVKGNNGNGKEDNKEKEVKEKETPKNSIKNGTTEKSTVDEGIRRSTRPSKIKDYAKMIRDRTQESDNEDDSDEVEDEYKGVDKSAEKRKSRRTNIKQSPKTVASSASAVAVAAATPTPRKRGRPRKEIDVTTPTPSKLKKEDKDEDDSDTDTKLKDNSTPSGKSSNSATDNGSSDKESKSPLEGKAASGLMMSPTGQTLKKVPIKALPPGIKPLPLPVNARSMTGGEVCEMQIGKKVVKVQKIVMTKAEVEAMAKRGLVEMKDGTMVLKQGIKLPSSDPSAIKNLVGDELAKESPSKGAPTRCEMEEDT